MKKTILSLLICFIATHVFAYENRNLLQGIATKTELGNLIIKNQKWVPYPDYKDREAWKFLFGDNEKLAISKGEKYLDYDWKVVKMTDYLDYQRTGTRTTQEAPYNSNTTALTSLFVAELAEGKGRFIDQIVNGIFQTCEMTSWSIAAHQVHQKAKGVFPDFSDAVLELVSTDVGAAMSWIYYFLNEEFDKMTPLINKRIKYELNRRIIEPYLTETRFWWMASNFGEEGGFVNNWNPWCNANLAQVFLLMENDETRLVDGIYKSLVSVDKFINYTNNDGACEEGPSYWGHAAGKLYDYLQVIYDASGGKVSLFDEPIIKNMGEYIVNSYIGDGWVVNFADASAREKINARLIYRYGKMIESRQMTEFAKYLKDQTKEEIKIDRDLFRTLSSLLAENELNAVDGKITKSKFVWYPETEFCYMSAGDLFLATKGGYNDESHNHNDIGTITLFANNKPILIDAGVGTYNAKTFSTTRYDIWTMQSDYHNLPKINGYSQVHGKKYKSKNVKANKAKNTFSIDISDAYPEEAGIVSWVNTYTLSKKELSITEIFDIKDATQANVLNFMTAGQAKEIRKGVVSIISDGQTMQLEYDANTFDVSFETVEQDDKRLSTVWGDKLTRISLKANKIENKGTYKINVKL